MNNLIFPSNTIEKTNFNCIGETVEKPFSGVFDGNGKTINGLIWKDEEAQVSLFGYVRGRNAIIKNLGLEDIDFLGKKVGAIVYGLSEGSIENCYTTGKIVGREDAAGILRSAFNSVVRGCYSTFEINSNNFSGGIALGNNIGGIISECKFSGKIISQYNHYTGGIVGLNVGLIEKSYFSGELIINDVYFEGWKYGDCAGGIAGINYPAGIIKTSYFCGTITCKISSISTGGYQGIGGIVGNNDNGSLVSDFYSIGLIQGTHEIGGIVGINSGEVRNCYSTSDISIRKGIVSDYAALGGIVGSNYGIVDKNVSMIPEIEIGSKYSGRVLGMRGSKEDNTVINYSWYNMKLISKNNFGESDFYQENVKNGFFVTTKALKDQITYEGLGWNFNEPDPVWEFSGEYMLPKLVGVGGQERLVTPSHLI